MLEGKIVIESTYGVGTEFKFAVKITNNNIKTTRVKKIKGDNIER